MKKFLHDSCFKIHFILLIFFIGYLPSSYAQIFLPKNDSIQPKSYLIFELSVPRYFGFKDRATSPLTYSNLVYAKTLSYKRSSIRNEFDYAITFYAPSILDMVGLSALNPFENSKETLATLSSATEVVVRRLKTLNKWHDAKQRMMIGFSTRFISVSRIMNFYESNSNIGLDIMGAGMISAKYIRMLERSSDSFWAKLFIPKKGMVSAEIDLPIIGLQYRLKNYVYFQESILSKGSNHVLDSYKFSVFNNYNFSGRVNYIKNLNHNNKIRLSYDYSYYQSNSSGDNVEPFKLESHGFSVAFLFSF